MQIRNAVDYQEQFSPRMHIITPKHGLITIYFGVNAGAVKTFNAAIALDLKRPTNDSQRKKANVLRYYIRADSGTDICLWLSKVLVNETMAL